MTDQERGAIGNRLRQLREKQPWTQIELSIASKVPLQTIKDLERGATKRPQPRTIRALAAALSVPAAYLLLGKTDESLDAEIEGGL
jgi:transcriptional regulator with XRE-family HTH domain